MNAADALPPPWVADLIARERAAAVDAALAPVETLAEIGADEPHNGHAPVEGEMDCPACWVEDIRAAVEQGRAAGGAS